MKQLILKQRKVTKVGVYYKLFVIFEIVLANILVGYCMTNYYLGHFRSYPYGFFLPFFVSYEIAMLTQFIITFYGSVYCSEVYRTFIIKLSRVIRELDFDNPFNCRRFENRLIFMHFTTVILRLIYVLLESFNKYSWYIFTYHIIIQIIDLEIASFITDIDLVSKLFGNINIELTKLAKTNIFIAKSLAKRIWSMSSSGYGLISNNFQKSRVETLKKIVSIYDQLTDIVDLINSSYSTAVIKKNILFKITLLTIIINTNYRYCL